MKNSAGSDGLSFAPGNAQAQGKRNDQQDSFGFSDPADAAFLAHGGLLAVVADGMGGLEHGAEASRIAVRSFLDTYTAKTRDEEISHALARAIEAADRAVFEFAATLKLEHEVGTTLVAAVFSARGLEWISVGDSALYLCQGGAVNTLARPHTLGARLDQLVEEGSLAPEAARDAQARDALTSYVGIGGLREIDRSAAPVAIDAGDAVVLCSDGLYRALEPDEIAATVSSAPDAQSVCDAMLEAALARDLPHQDNVTVLCVKVMRRI
jgi:protein phosphatase